MTPIGRRDAIRLAGGALIGLAALGRAGGAARAERAGELVTRPIGRHDERLPVVGLGTSGAFEVGRSPDARAPLAAVLRELVALGAKLVDTAPSYGTAETVVGDLAAELGVTSRLFLATKVSARGRDAGVAQLRESMRRLRVDRLDLVQVHNLVDVDTHLATLDAWKGEGRVRYVGITDYRTGRHEALERLVAARPLDFVQVNYSVGERGAEERLLPLARDRGVAVIANRPFARGDLFARVRARPLPPFAAELGCETWAQLLLKFVVSHPAVTCAIPATSDPEHLRENVAAAYGPMPDAAMRARIAAVAT